MAPVRICVEKGRKLVFASALDWPGWCRPGKDPELALAALLAYASRYAPIATGAGVHLPTTVEFEVIETQPGDGTTDFGAPSRIAQAEADPLELAEAGRLASLLSAAWDFLEAVSAKAPASLRRGPRGGGRDTAQLLGHVHAAEDAYSRKVGVRIQDWQERRTAFLATLEAGGRSPGAWPLAYAARRTAWHALDHAWEIEDKSE